MKKIVILIPNRDFDVQCIDHLRSLEIKILSKEFLEELIEKSDGYLNPKNYDSEESFRILEKAGFNVSQISREGVMNNITEDLKEIYMLDNSARTVFMAYFTDPVYNYKYTKIEKNSKPATI